MSVVSPEPSSFGTLIVIFAKAVGIFFFFSSFAFIYTNFTQRNLPNRRRLGKQSPYCVARIGVDAKRSKTDQRGGQTPIW